jgi:sulfide:quinone oxidoreductase
MTTELPAPGAAAATRQAHHRVVVVGGGNAGISVAARLRDAVKGLDVAIVEPSTKHYYQPLWTLVGGGVFPRERSEHDESSVIPAGVTWIREAAVECCPDQDAILTSGGLRLSYDFLVVAPGIQVDWQKIKGLPEALGHDGVCSNYSYDSVGKTWEFIEAFKGGNAVFTHPGTPIKCGGAPQKIMYLADDQFRKAGVRDKTNITFGIANAAIFAVPKYAKTLTSVYQRKGVDVRFRHDLVEIRADAREAVFENLDTGDSVTLAYDLLHVTPPMSSPDFIKRSPLANAGGWVDVDKFTLQHVRYPNVFGLGDASSLPTSKTGAAIRKQAPVLAKNLVAAMASQPLPARYDGYTACPLVTGYGKLVMAEFDYDLTPRETFPFDQSKERRSMYLFKAYALPALYWRGIMKGRL